MPDPVVTVNGEVVLVGGWSMSAPRLDTNVQEGKDELSWENIRLSGYFYSTTAIAGGTPFNIRCFIPVLEQVCSFVAVIVRGQCHLRTGYYDYQWHSVSEIKPVDPRAIEDADEAMRHDWEEEHQH